MRPIDSDAAELLAIAERLLRLPAYDRRRPEAFYEDKSEIAAQLKIVAHRMTGRVEGMPPVFRPRRALVTNIEVAGRRVMVQRRRAAFGV